jgi:hypothetical protein
VCCTLVSCEGVGVKVTGIKFMTVLITRSDAACFFSLGYTDIAALSPWQRYILYVCWFTEIRQLLSLIRVEAAELAQAGFGTS